MAKIEFRKKGVKVDGKKAEATRDERGWSVKSLLRGRVSEPEKKVVKKAAKKAVKKAAPKKRGRPPKKK